MRDSHPTSDYERVGPADLARQNPVRAVQPSAPGDIGMATEAPYADPADRPDGLRDSRDPPSGDSVVRDLVDRARKGDRDATNRLFATHLRALYIYILGRVGGNAADAEDVVQETVTAAVVGLSSYRRDAGFWAWLTAIARNKATDHVRSSTSRERRVRPVGGGDDDLERAAGTFATEDLFARAEESQAVRAAVASTMAALEPDDRVLLVEKYRKGRSVAAIASARGWTLKAAESMLYRARERFRDVFAAIARGAEGAPVRAKA